MLERTRSEHRLGGRRLHGAVCRALIAAAGALVGMCVLATTAFAAAGGGSAGFSGGGDFGGGGDLGGGFGGGGFSGGGGVDGAEGTVVGVIILIVAAITFLIWLAHRLARAQRWTMRVGRRRKASHREKQVAAAAAEAAEEDPEFAVEVVHDAAARLFAVIQKAWSAGDRKRLKRLVGPELWVEWDRRLRDFKLKGWRNLVQPLGAPTIQYVGLRRVGNDRDDRVVVRIEARLRDYVRTRAGVRITRTGSSSEITRLAEYWTLAKNPNGQNGDLPWIVVSIEQEREGGHELREPIVATSWADDAALSDEALVELATADAVPEGTSIAELADLGFVGDARIQANDLSLVDGRFAPAVLEVAARRAVAAWAQGVDGDRRPLLKIADRPVIEALLHPGDPGGRTRVVVRGPRVTSIRIAALDPSAAPPTMNLEVELAGRRYIEDRDTTGIVSGSPSRDSHFTEHWTLALSDDDEHPWRITAVNAPAVA